MGSYFNPANPAYRQDRNGLAEHIGFTEDEVCGTGRVHDGGEHRFRLKAGFPARDEAMRILTDSEKRNPGPWKEHSMVTARCAELTATACQDLDPEKAYVLGLLHDIGRRFGKGHMKHIIDGYLYMKELGYPEAARICITHSFSIQKIQDYIGQFDVTPEELELIRALLDSYVYDDYDRLIQLCDSVAMPEGPADLETRMDSVAVRYGYYPPEKRRRNYELKEYFEGKTGRNFYEVIGKE